MAKIAFSENINEALKKAQDGMKDSAAMEVFLGKHDGVKYSLIAEPDAESWGGMQGYSTEKCLVITDC